MYYNPYGDPYRFPYYSNMPMFTDNSNYWTYPHALVHANEWNSHQPQAWHNGLELRDYGPNPSVINIDEATKQNSTYRTALWTGDYLQVTLMSLNPGEDIGLEMHPDVDQFLRIEQGQGMTEMGNTKSNLNFVRNVQDDSTIMIPAGTWHNLTNTGNIPLKLYSIYAPKNHPFGTIHRTKADAMAAERH